MSSQGLQFYSGFLFWRDIYPCTSCGPGVLVVRIAMFADSIHVEKSVIVAMSGDVALNCALHGQFIVPE